MKKINDLFIRGEKINLRSYRPDDIDMIMRLENHPDPRATLFYARPVTKQQLTEKMQQLASDPNAVVLTISSREDDQPLGQTALLRIDWVGRMAIFFLGIADKENWSKRYGSEAVKMIIKYAFDTLNLNRIQLHVAVENQAAVKIYQKQGFQIEGTLREAMYHEGRFSDFYVMGILKSAYTKTSA
jgi:diamine N-acetyltransferase